MMVADGDFDHKPIYVIVCSVSKYLRCSMSIKFEVFAMTYSETLIFGISLILGFHYGIMQ